MLRPQAFLTLGTFFNPRALARSLTLEVEPEVFFQPPGLRVQRLKSELKAFGAWAHFSASEPKLGV